MRVCYSPGVTTKHPVHRAIKAGLIVARSGKGNAYALYAPSAAPYDGC
jgi:hypothetical protein